MAGYSKTPLLKKLGIIEGFRVKIENAPDNFLELIRPLPEKVVVSSRLKKQVNIWHLFIRSKKELDSKLRRAIKGIPENGVIWVSWPKKSSGVAADITEDGIREAALRLGLVDVKVCAIDDTWSGLKLVIRRENRK